ncbi:MAG: SRPBCC family protein [Mycobacterium sp.]|nr:SRPBCC family protein [Mycobacterium sp.]
MDTLDITRTIDINAPIQRVWDALTKADLIAQWFGDSAEFEASPGGTGFFGWNTHGKFRVLVEQVEAPHTLVYRWAHREADAEPAPGNSTMVRFDLTEIDGGTRLDLCESGFENLTDPTTAHAENSGGWTAELGDLVEYLRASA